MEPGTADRLWADEEASPQASQLAGLLPSKHLLSVVGKRRQPGNLATLEERRICSGIHRQQVFRPGSLLQGERYQQVEEPHPGVERRRQAEEGPHQREAADIHHSQLQ